MRTRLIPLLALLFCLALPARAEIVVVVHPDSPIKSLSLHEASDLYLGRSRNIGGEPALVLDQPADSPLRSRFFMLINGMDLRRVNAYWARLQFSGDMQPPAQLRDNQAIIETVRRNRFAIGYVSAEAFVPGTLRPVLRLQE